MSKFYPLDKCFCVVSWSLLEQTSCQLALFVGDCSSVYEITSYKH